MEFALNHDYPVADELSSMRRLVIARVSLYDYRISPVLQLIKLITLHNTSVCDKELASSGIR